MNVKDALFQKNRKESDLKIQYNAYKYTSRHSLVASDTTTFFLGGVLLQAALSELMSFS